MEVPSFMEGYPAARPSDTSREEIFCAKDFTDVDNKSRQVPGKMLGDLDKLMKHLLKSLTSDLQKVRSIFVWLSVQPILTMTFPKNVKPNTPEAWLKRIRVDRSLYTDFFTVLCRAAGVPCAIIEGSAKGAGFEVGEDGPLRLKNRWNAVYVQGEWRLINVPWAFIVTDGVETGAWELLETDEREVVREKVVSTKEVRQDLDEFWFLTNPEDFIALCLAKDRKWQLLENPWSEDDFRSIPKYAQDIFTSDWDLISEASSVLNADGGRCMIAFSHPTDLATYSLNFNLYFNAAQSPKPLPDELPLDRYVVQNSDIGRKELLTKLPQDGIYKMEVAGVRDGVLIPLAQFRIKCQNVKEQSAPFPEGLTEIGYTETAHRGGLVQPSHKHGFIVAKEGEKVDMNFKLAEGRPHPNRVVAMMTHDSRQPEDLNEYIDVQTTDSEVIIKCQVPNDKTKSDYGLSIIDYLSDGIYKTLAHYIITKDGKMTFPDKQAFIQNMSCLLSSIKQQDVPTFQRSKRCLGDNVDPLTRGKVYSFSLQVNKIKDGKLRLLLQAMGGSDSGEIQRALDDYESMEDVEESAIKRARAILDLLHALKQEELPHTLEKAVRQAYDVGLKNNAVLEKAEEMIITHHEKELDEAYYARTLPRLKDLMDIVDRSILAERIKLRKPYEAAKEVYDHLQRIKALTDDIGKLSSGDLKKMAGDKKKGPADHMQSVLMATFILLGEKEDNLWEWKHIQNLLERRGQLGVAKVMAALDVDTLRDEQVNLAQGHTKFCNLDVVSNANPHGALFLRWAQAIMEEKRGRDAVRHHHAQISSSNSQ